MTAIFAGSFDPFTLGHRDIAVRASKLFSSVVVAVAEHTDKQSAPLETRLRIAKAAVADINGVAVVPFVGLLTDFCKGYKDCVLVRGVRGARDAEYEREHARIYASLGGPDTVCFMCDPALEHVSSSAVRTLVGLGALPDGYAVKGTEDMIKNQYALRG